MVLRPVILAMSRPDAATIMAIMAFPSCEAPTGYGESYYTGIEVVELFKKTEAGGLTDLRSHIGHVQITKARISDLHTPSLLQPRGSAGPLSPCA